MCVSKLTEKSNYMPHNCQFTVFFSTSSFSQATKHAKQIARRWIESGLIRGLVSIWRANYISVRSFFFWLRRANCNDHVILACLIDDGAPFFLKPVFALDGKKKTQEVKLKRFLCAVFRGQDLSLPWKNPPAWESTSKFWADYCRMGPLVLNQSIKIQSEIFLYIQSWLFCFIFFVYSSQSLRDREMEILWTRKRAKKKTTFIQCLTQQEICRIW